MLPTARLARGLPARFATSFYVRGPPLGILATTASTFFPNVFIREVPYSLIRTNKRIRKRMLLLTICAFLIIHNPYFLILAFGFASSAASHRYHEARDACVRQLRASLSIFAWSGRVFNP